MTPIINSALLGLIAQSGSAIATLVEGLERDELLRSRLTLAEVLRQLKTLADSVGQLESRLRCCGCASTNRASRGCFAWRREGGLV